MTDGCTLVGVVFAAAVVLALVLMVVRATRGQAGTATSRFKFCPRCDRAVRPDEARCVCGLDLGGPLAERLERVRVAGVEIRHLQEAGDLDEETAGRVLRRLDDRRDLLLHPPARPALPPPLPPRRVPEPSFVPTRHPVVAAGSSAPVADAPGSPPTPVSHAPGTPRRSLADVFGQFMHERNILWGELAGGLLIVGCSIALVLSLWRTLEVLPYFPVLLFAGITAAVFGAGQYTLHHWKLAGTSRGLLVIALLLTPLNLLLFADGRHGSSDAIDLAVKGAAVLAFLGLVRTAGRDLVGADALPGRIPRRWLLALAVVGAPASQIIPTAEVVPVWLPLACFVAACWPLTWVSASSPFAPRKDALSRSERRHSLSESTGSALLMFVGLGLFAAFAAWGFVVIRADDLADALRRIAPAAMVAAVPVLSAGLIVQRRVREPIGLKVAGTGVALSAVVVMVAGLYLAWPDPPTLLAVAALAGGVLWWAAHRDRLPWLMAGAIPFLALAAGLMFQGAADGWVVPADRDPGEWLSERLTSAGGGAALVGFALLVLAGSEAMARTGRMRQALADALGAAVVAAVGLYVVSIRGLEQPSIAAGAYLVAAAGFLAASGRWPFRVVAQVGVWLLLPATLWALHAAIPGDLAAWGCVVAVEGTVLAIVGLVGGLRGTAARDVAGATVLLALGLGLGADHLPHGAAHTGTLAAITATLFVLAGLYRRAELVWAGAVAGLFALVHLTGLPLEVRPWTAATVLALLGHATVGTIAARLLRSPLYVDPLRNAARITTCLAVPLLLVPPAELSLAWAGLTAWTGLLWLAAALLWRERGAFGLFQGAWTWAAVLVGVAWIGRQDWASEWPFHYFDPRALTAYGIAVGTLSVGWVLARRSLRRVGRVRELWDEVRPSVDQFVLGGLVVGFALLAIERVAPAASAELTPVGVEPAFRGLADVGSAVWLWLGVLAVALVLHLRWTPKTDWPLAGLLVLALMVPVLGATEFAADLTAASALRWGLGLAFLAGSALLALRGPIARLAAGLGFPTALTRPGFVGLYALVAAAAGAVVVLSAGVADIGLAGLVPAGPGPDTIFAQVGWVAGNVLPLAFVVIGLAGTALRERWAGYAFAAGLVLIATVSGGYALGVVTAGSQIDPVVQMRLGLLAAGSAAVWALAWLAVGRRVPGRAVLTIQAWMGLLGLVPLAAVAVLLRVARPDRPQWPSPAVLGDWGWPVLGSAAVAAAWRTTRVRPLAVGHVAGWALCLAGVFVAASVEQVSGPVEWLFFHVLAIAWAVGGVAMAAAFRKSTNSVRVWPEVFAVGLVVLALRGGWADPWRPWLSASILLVAAGLVGAVAVRARSPWRAHVAGGLVVVAGWLVWVGVGPDSPSSLALALGTAFATAAAGWALSRVEPVKPSVPAFSHFGAALGLILVGLALQDKFAGRSADPWGWNWAALGAVAVAWASLCERNPVRGPMSGVAASDPLRGSARPGLGLFAVGALATALVIADLRPGSIWSDQVTPLILAEYALFAAFVFARRPLPGYAVPAQAVLAVVVLVLGVRTAVDEPGLAARLAGPLAVGLLAVAAGLTTRRVGLLRPVTLVLATAAIGLVGWAVPDPTDVAPWLNRQAWLFAAVAGAALVCTGLLTRLPAAGWVRDAWRVGAVLGALAVVAYLANVGQQIPLFDPVAKRTPLDPPAVWAGLAGLLGLIGLALWYALRPDRDPLGPTPHGRGGYVYLAEGLLVLVFVQVKLNVPQAFRPEAVRYWTFVVMAVAFVGVGLAELFARRGTVVLARPLLRTGVLLPLLPLLAFWAKPPQFVFAFAEDRAPGLLPLVGYLRGVPQHFESYALLWFLAGLLYGLVALARRSFGWALLGAVAANFGVWALLSHHQVPAAVHPQAWAIPLALIVLVSEHVHRGRLRAEASAGLRYLGISLIYVASAADLFIAGVGESVWLPVVLAALCLAGVVAGVLLRVRAFLYLGIGFLFLDVFAMVWHAAVDRAQTWVWYASGIVLGAMILAVFAVVEKRRADVAGLVSRLREWD